jgi:hypothetical protein
MLVKLLVVSWGGKNPQDLTNVLVKNEKETMTQPNLGAPYHLLAIP